MKIIDWENKVSKIYSFIKTQNIEDLDKCIKDYDKSQARVFCALQQEDLIFYLLTNDNIHYAGMGYICGDSFKVIDLVSNYLRTMEKYEPILLADFVAFCENSGFKKLNYEELTYAYKSIINKQLEFSVEFVSEGAVLNEDFYALYIFNNLEEEKEYLTNTGYCKNFVIIGSADGVNICSYFIMDNGRLKEDGLNKFIKTVYIKDLDKTI